MSELSVSYTEFFNFDLYMLKLLSLNLIIYQTDLKLHSSYYTFQHLKP